MARTRFAGQPGRCGNDGDLGWPDAVAHARGRSIDIEESNELPIHTDARAMTGTGRNPWVAVDVSTDPVAHARVLARAHERSLAGAETPVGVRDPEITAQRASTRAPRQ